MPVTESKGILLHKGGVRQEWMDKKLQLSWQNVFLVRSVLITFRFFTPALKEHPGFPLGLSSEYHQTEPDVTLFQ